MTNPRMSNGTPHAQQQHLIRFNLEGPISMPAALPGCPATPRGVRRPSGTRYCPSSTGSRLAVVPDTISTSIFISAYMWCSSLWLFEAVQHGQHRRQQRLHWPGRLCLFGQSSKITVLYNFTGVSSPVVALANAMLISLSKWTSFGMYTMSELETKSSSHNANSKYVNVDGP